MILASPAFTDKLTLLRRTPIYKLVFDDWMPTYSTHRIKSFVVSVDESDVVADSFTIDAGKSYPSDGSFIEPDGSLTSDLFISSGETVIGDSLPYLGIPNGVQGQVYPEQGHASIGVVGVVITDIDETITELVCSDVIARRAQLFAGFEGIDEDEFAAVFTGLVSAVRMTPDFTGYEFQFYSPSTLTNKQIFDLASTTLLTDLSAGEVVSFTISTPDTFTDTNSGDNETYVVIDNEIIYCQPAVDFATSGIMEILSRGTTPVDHTADTQVRQLLRIGPGHPVDILLLICQSAEVRWGLGISPSYMDFTGLAKARSILGTSVTMDFQLMDPENAMQFFEQELYRVCGAYPFVTADGKISMKVVARPSVLDIIEVIDHDYIVTDEEGKPEMEWSQGWDGSLGEIINHVFWKLDHNPVTGEFESLAEFDRPASIATYGDKPITLESKGLRLEDVNTLNFIIERSASILDRSENGIPLIAVRAFLQKELIESGDLVSFSSRLLPDRVTKTRGLTNALMEVVNRSLHFDTGRVEMQLLFTSFNDLPLLITSACPTEQPVYGEAYSYTLSASGGVGPYTWSLLDGAFPDGLTLDPDTGEISGTPTETGDFPWTAQVADSSVPPLTAQIECVFSLAAVGFTLIAHNYGVSADAGATCTTTALDSTGADLIVVACATYAGISNTVVYALSDSKGNTWTPLSIWSASQSTRIRLFYCVNPTVGSGHTFTATSTTLTAYPSVYAAAFVGAAASSPFDQESGAASLGASSLATFAIVPTQDNELLITALCEGATSGTHSVDSGFTILDQVTTIPAGPFFGGGLAYKIQTAAASVNPTWTQGSSTALAVAIASFKAG